MSERFYHCPVCKSRCDNMYLDFDGATVFELGVSCPWCGYSEEFAYGTTQIRVLWRPLLLHHYTEPWPAKQIKAAYAVARVVWPLFALAHGAAEGAQFLRKWVRHG